MKNRKLIPLKKNFLENPPIMLRQKGYDCKSYALGAVLQWLFASKLIHHKPMPPRQRNDREYKGSSIRHLLKHHFNSAVGEVHNIEDLAAVAEKQEEVAAYFCQCKIEVQYYATLRKAIDQGLSPIIFFEVENGNNPRVGLPVSKGGKIEHAVPVVGYFYDQSNRLFFRVSQWENYFDIDAKELFISTSQLVHQRIAADSYFKIKTEKNEGGWMPERDILCLGLEERVIKRKLGINPTINDGLRQKILIVDSKIKPRFKPGEMPVKFNRADSVVHASEIKALPSKEVDKDREWDQQIEHNLKDIALNEKIEKIESDRFESCLIPVTRSQFEDWDFDMKLANEDDLINPTRNINPNYRLLLFPLSESQYEPFPFPLLEQEQESKLSLKNSLAK